MGKNHIVSRLQEVLRDLFDSRHRGTLTAPFYRSQGFADGYMTALGDLGVFSDREMLELVSRERRRASGSRRESVPGSGEAVQRSGDIAESVIELS